MRNLFHLALSEDHKTTQQVTYAFNKLTHLRFSNGLIAKTVIAHAQLKCTCIFMLVFIASNMGLLFLIAILNL